MKLIAHDSPLVSVVIPTYNRAALVTETVQSILSQTYSNFEIIIVDDGSTDDTEKIVNDLNNSQIRYFKIPHTGSFGTVRNVGLKNARGEYIAFVDSDDLWEKQKLELQVSAMRDESLDFCFTQVSLFGDTTVKVPAYRSLKGKLLEQYLQEGYFAYYPSSLLFKKRVLQTTGFLNEDVPYGADPEFFVTLCHHFSGIFLPETLTRIRKHQRNTSSQDPLFSCPEMIDLLTRIYGKGFISKRIFKSSVSKFYYKIGLIQKDRGYTVSAFRHFASYLYHRPFHWKGWLRLLQLPFQILVPRQLSESR
jgi:glycosyltransferase involved in cell wall biosynthesis